MRNKKKPFFSKDKWLTLFHSMLEEPILYKWEQGPFFEKRHYHKEGFRLILFRYDNGTQRVLLYEGNTLEIEGTYEQERFFVTSETMLRPSFLLLQEDIVTFMEIFAEQESNGTNDRLVLEGIKHDVQQIHRYQAHPSIEQEAEELWRYFSQNKQAIAYAPDMKRALDYLKKQAIIDTKGEEEHENTVIYDQRRL